MITQPPMLGQPPATIAELEDIDLNGLRAIWRKQWGNVPTMRSPDVLRIVIAWRLQARTHGGLDSETRRKLRKKAPVEAEGLDLGVGTTITRKWQGRTYEVGIEEKGFRWEGTLYVSLSAVATAITGTRWNGPRFFGMREKKK